MTDPHPQAIEPARVQSPGVAPRPRRRLVWLVVAMMLFGLAGRWSYLRVTEGSRVLAAIEAIPQGAPQRGARYPMDST